MAGRSDWQSSLYAALAPLAVLRPGSRRMAVGSSGRCVVYLFLTWFLFTHRLDRFWLPLLPILAVLAGLGADWVRHAGWSALLWTDPRHQPASRTSPTIRASWRASTSGPATSTFLRHDLPRAAEPAARIARRQLPPDARVLLVGQAAVFHLSHPIVYNTVFNDETIEELARGRDTEGLRQALRDRGLTHIYRRLEGDPAPSPAGRLRLHRLRHAGTLRRWVAEGLLDRPVAYGDEQELYGIR